MEQSEPTLARVLDVMQVALGNQERTTATEETRRLMGDPDSDVCKVVDAIRERVRHAFDMNHGLPARALDDPDFAAYWKYMETKRPKTSVVELEYAALSEPLDNSTTRLVGMGEDSKGSAATEEHEVAADEMLHKSQPALLQPLINRVAAAAPFASVPDEVLLQTVRVLSQERHERNLPAGEIFSRVRTQYGCRFRGRLERALEFGAVEGVLSVEDKTMPSTSTRGSTQPGATASYYALAITMQELYARLVHTLCLHSNAPVSSLAEQLITWARFFDVPPEWHIEIKNWNDASLRILKGEADNE